MQDSFWKELDAFVPVLANYLTETRATQQAETAENIYSWNFQFLTSTAASKF